MTTVQVGQTWVARQPDRTGHHRVARVVDVRTSPLGRPTHVTTLATYQTTTTIKSFLARYELDDDATPAQT